MVWMVIAVILILIGTGLFVYSGTCITVEKNGKKRSVIHKFDIAIGILLILISIVILYFIAKDLKTYQKAPPGAILVSVPEKFGNWLGDNINSQVKFTKVIGNYIDAINKGIKGIYAPRYNFYGTEPGAEQVGAPAAAT